MAQMGFPWLNIPMFADVDEPQVFVGRREELAVLYRGLVQAGNAVRDGRFGVHRKFAVHGYMGVGKSALILETLRMLREARSAGDELPAELPLPEDPERWLILRISGKHVTGLDGLVASLRWTMAENDSADDGADGSVYPRLALFEHMHRQAEKLTRHALHLSPIHHLLRTREARLYENVRSDLRALAATLEQIVQRAHEHGRTDTTAASEAGDGSVPPAQLEEAHVLVSALNHFFRGAMAAGLPTLLILDDFDDLAFTAGSSLTRRARTLNTLLNELSQLSPTCLVLSLRSEFLSEPLLRQFRRIFLAPLPRSAASELLARWAAIQDPPFAPEPVARLQQLGERFLGRFAADDPVVVPFRFLQLIAWLANNYLIYNLADADDAQMLWRYFGGKYPLDAVRALRAILRVMPVEHVLPCVSASPVDAGPYGALSAHELYTLERAGLLRGAAAANPEDPRLVLDPLIGYLHVASNPALHKSG